jgi:beta-N-acetylhexosaminidase
VGGRRLLARYLVTLGAALLLGQAATASAPAAARQSPPTLAQLVGQHLLVRMAGLRPTPSFLRLVRAGRIGGIVLFADNIPTGGPARLIATLQAAARAGGQPPLLIAVDQEGGTVKRLPGPPTVPPSGMATVSAARAQGLAAGRYLHRLGISVDLAPVLDVPASPQAFITARAFSVDAATVGARGAAFAEGVTAGGVAPTAKHFPGLGRLVQTTDDEPGRIAASRQVLATDLAPFRSAVRAGVPVVMVGTAVYPAYGSELPAACSRKVVDGLLRHTLGFRGVAITDDLATPGVRPSFAPAAAAVRAVQAGIDMAMVLGPATGQDAYSALLAAARRGRLPRAQLQASYERILALKRRFAAA